MKTIISSEALLRGETPDFCEPGDVVIPAPEKQPTHPITTTP